MNRLIGALVALLIFSSCGTPEKKSSSGMDGRAGVSFGSWGGKFSESFTTSETGNTQTAQVTVSPAKGMEAFFGTFASGPFFIDWTPTYFMPSKWNSSNSPSSWSYYTAFASGEVGISLAKMTHFLPIEAFVGVDDGNFAFINGAKTHMSGPVFKAGADFIPLYTDTEHGSMDFGLRAEYRKSFMSIDSYGSAPLSTSVWFWYVGVVVMGWSDHSSSSRH